MRAWLARAGGVLPLFLAGGVLISAVHAEKLKPVEPLPVAAAKPAASAPVEKPRPLRHGVFRFTSYPAAWTAAQKSNKPILVFASAPSCPHCVRMIADAYRKPKLSRMVVDSFETVYVDRAEQPELAEKLHVRWYPTTIIVSPDNKVLDVIEGYVDQATLSRRLNATFAAHVATNSEAVSAK